MTVVPHLRSVQEPAPEAREVPDPPEPWVAWVQAARGGDRAAFERLYRRFYGVVKGLVMRHRVPEVADDVAQDVFLTAWRRLEDLDEDRAFPGWIATMARRAALDVLRRAERRATTVTPPGLADPRQVPADATFVLAAIKSLPEAYVEPLLLRLVAGCSGPEIAAITGLTPGSVRVNLHRGTSMLRERLKEARP